MHNYSVGVHAGDPALALRGMKIHPLWHDGSHHDWRMTTAEHLAKMSLRHAAVATATQACHALVHRVFLGI